MAIIRNQQFYTAKLTRSLSLGGSDTTVYVDTLPTETTGALILNPTSKTRKEKITYTGVASSPISLTGVTRGVPFATVTGTATSTARVAANCYKHSAGEDVIMAPGHYEALMADVLNGTTAQGQDLNMGGFKITNLGTPTATTDGVTKAYADALAIAGAPNASTTVQGLVEEATQAEVDARTVTGGTGAKLFAPLDKRRGIHYHDFAASSGGTDTYAITVTPAPTAYSDGDVFVFEADVANTGTASLNVNGLGAATINKRGGGFVLRTGDIIAGSVNMVVYDLDSTSFTLLSSVAREFVGQLGAEIYAVTTGSANAYALTLDPTPTSFVAGLTVRFTPNFTNTSTTPTLNVNSLGAATLKRSNGAAVVSGEITSAGTHTAIYDGTAWILQSLVTPVVTASTHGTTTKDAGDATGVQNITHGLGTTPRIVRITAIAVDYASSPIYAQTVWANSVQSSMSVYRTAASASSITTDFRINTSDPSGGNAYTIGVMSVGATTIDITWTKTGTSDGSYTLLWSAEA